jgi:D-proline reductase (dithiol) PrdB
MARLEDIDEPLRKILVELDCPSFDGEPFVRGVPLAERRIAIVSTAGIHRRGDRPFVGRSGEYRPIPGDTRAGDLVMSHVSANFDRTGFQRDWNVILPVDRLAELVAEGTVGAVASFHYSFMGATSPTVMEPATRRLAGLLRADSVDGVLLVPV